MRPGWPQWGTRATPADRRGSRPMHVLSHHVSSVSNRPCVGVFGLPVSFFAGESLCACANVVLAAQAAQHDRRETIGVYELAAR